MEFEKLYELRKDPTEFAIQMGFRTVEIRQGYARGELEITDQHRNSLGTVHGGCIFAIADTNGATAAMTCGHYCTTVNGDIHFLRAARNIRKLIVVAREAKAGKTRSGDDIEVSDEEGRLIAKGLFSYYTLDQPI